MADEDQVSMTPLFRLKICGITSPEDARMVADAAGGHADSPGVIAIGLNFVAGSPRCVGIDQARAIRQAVPAGIRCVGVFANAEVERMLATANEVGLDAIQLHGELDGGDLGGSDPPRRCRELSPLPVIRAIRLGADGLDAARSWLAESRQCGAAPAMMLVDAAVPRGTPAGLLGGSGEKADWRALARERPLGVPTALAGGLTPANVEQAVYESSPAAAGGAVAAVCAVDAASGVETAPGRKDPAKVRNFIEAAARALGFG